MKFEKVWEIAGWGAAADLIISIALGLLGRSDGPWLSAYVAALALMVWTFVSFGVVTVKGWKTLSSSFRSVLLLNAFLVCFVCCVVVGGSLVGDF